MKKEKIAETSDKKISQITLPDERYYEVNGKYLPSVTWILESYPKGIGFYKWLASEGWNEAQSKKELAGDKGSKVHNAIQELLKGKEVKWGDKFWSELDGEFSPLTIEEWEALIAFKNFWDDKKPQLIASERVCWSGKYDYAGTIDAILMLDNKVTIVDWKTSRSIYPTYSMQVAAYLRAEAETGDYKATQAAIVRLGTNHKSGYEVKILDEIYRYFQQFLAVKSVWAIENGEKQPELVEIPESIKLEIKKLVKKDGGQKKS